MFIEVFIAIEVIALIMFILSFIPLNGQKNWLFCLLTIPFFLFLAISSLSMNTIKQDQISNTTSYNQSIYIDYVCDGQPANCDYWDGSEQLCLIAGCTYSDGLCSGTPYECNYWTTERECIAQIYCEWTGTTTNATVINYNYDSPPCETCTYKDNNLAYFNMGMAFITLIHGLALMLVKTGRN